MRLNFYLIFEAVIGHHSLSSKIRIIAKETECYKENCIYIIYFRYISSYTIKSIVANSKYNLFQIWFSFQMLQEKISFSKMSFIWNNLTRAIHHEMKIVAVSSWTYICVRDEKKRKEGRGEVSTRGHEIHKNPQCVCWREIYRAKGRHCHTGGSFLSP